jgi:beta propeller repeat protein
MKPKDRLILPLLFLGIASFSSAQTLPEENLPPRQAQQNTAAKPRQPEYVPGEVLVKFKEGVDPQAVLKAANISAQSIGRIHSITPAVAEFKKTQKLEKDSDGWYWFLGKKYKETEEIPDEQVFAEAYKSMPKTEQSIFRTYQVKLSPKVDVIEAVKKLKNLPAVENAQPNYICYAMDFPESAPNDTFYNHEGLWGLQKIHAPEVWNKTQGEGVVVAVIDSGADYNHEDLADNIWLNSGEFPGVDDNHDGLITLDELKSHGLTDTNKDGKIDLADLWGSKFQDGIDNDGNGYKDDFAGWNFSGYFGFFWTSYNNNEIIDYNGHGTHVSGIIAASGNNNKGIIGVVPKAKIMAVKALNTEGSGTSTDLANAISYAAKNGAKVINNSWGSRYRDASNAEDNFVIKDAVIEASQRKAIVVFAAGNASDNADYYYSPNIEEAIIVGAADSADSRANFSNFGSRIDIVAPGVKVLSLNANKGNNAIINQIKERPDLKLEDFVVDTNYLKLSGTSMAAPYVSGIAALMVTLNKDISPQQAKQYLRASADDIGAPGFDLVTGHGRLNAQTAIEVNSQIEIAFAEPSQCQSINQGQTELVVKGTVAGKSFAKYQLLYLGYGESNWHNITDEIFTPAHNGNLGTWPCTNLPVNKYLICLKVTSKEGWVFDEVRMVYKDRKKIELLPSGYDFKGTYEGREIFQEDALSYGDSSDLYILRRGAVNWWKAFYLDLPSWDDEGLLRQDLLSKGYIDQNDIILEKFKSLQTSSQMDLDVYFSNKRESIFSWLKDMQEGRFLRTILSVYYPFYPKCNLRVNENMVVYDDSDEGIRYILDSDIFYYNLATKEEGRIQKTGEQRNPAYSNGKIVWQQRKYKDDGWNNDYWQIALYDMAGGTVSPITATSKDEVYPLISGNWVVWAEVEQPENYSKGSIYAYKITEGITYKISDVVNLGPNAVRLSGDKIVWDDWREGGREINLFDLSLWRKDRLLESSSFLAFPDIYGDFVIWMESFFGDWDIILYNLKTKLKTRVTSRPQGEYIAIATEKGVVCKDNVANYLYEFCPPVINSINKTVVAGNQPVIITGKNFGDAQEESKVQFANGIIAPIRSWSDTRIVCMVPKNAQTSALKIVTVGGASNAVTLTIDSTRPVITHTPVVSPVPADKSLTISASITDTGSGVKQAILFWRKRKAMEFGMRKYEEKPMTDQGNGSYQAELPGDNLSRGSYSYYLAACDNAGNWKYTAVYSFRMN